LAADKFRTPYTPLGNVGNTTGTYATPTYRLANCVDTRYQPIGAFENQGNTWYNRLAKAA
jgi:hypothetical protein